LLEPLITAVAQRKLAEDLGRLKAMVEASAREVSLPRSHDLAM
jgi:hypothetical protein